VSQRGGKRPGAGRPRGDAKKIDFYLQPELDQEARRAAATMALSDWVRGAAVAQLQLQEQAGAMEWPREPPVGRACRVPLWLDRSLWESLRRAAAAAGLDLGAWIRRAMRRAIDANR